MNDLRFAFRQLLKNPGFTAVAVLILALGIGVNTAAFSVANAVLFRPLPFTEPERLVWLANTGPATEGLSAVTTRSGTFQDWRSQNQSFDSLGAYFAFFDFMDYRLLGGDEPVRLQGVGVSREFLDVLGVRLFLGRNFTPEEANNDGAGAVILGHTFWQRQFNGDVSVIGRAVTVNDRPTTIVGVLPASFDFSGVFAPGSRVDVILPHPINQETDGWGNTLAVIGRLKPRVSMDQARAEFELINRRLREAHPERGAAFGATLSPLSEHLRGRWRFGLGLLWGAAAMVLLIACGNLGGLLIARAWARRQEMAVRVALGAGRGRLLRQLLIESVVLSGLGALLALPLASVITRTVASSSTLHLPLQETASVDGPALLLTLGTSVVVGLLFGIVPALRLSREVTRSQLAEGAAMSGSSPHRGRWGEMLVAAQISLTVVLLVGAGLLGRSLIQLLNVPLGFQPDQLLAWRIDPGTAYASPEKQVAFYAELLQRTRAVPGVTRAGLTDTLPLGRGRSIEVRALGESYAVGDLPSAATRVIDPAYLGTMGIQLIAGRAFNDGDRADTERVALINEGLARRLWPGREPLDQIVMVGDERFRVVGIAGNVRATSLEAEGGFEMYSPVAQWGAPSVQLVVRTAARPSTVVPAVRAAFHELDPDLPSSEFQPITALVGQAVAGRRFNTLLLASFAGLSLLLASLGVYGLLSFLVTRRTREIGLRMALGAARPEVLGLVLRQGMALVLVGTGVGLFAALALARFLGSLLFEIGPYDPIIFSIVPLVLATAALLACWLPARRAARVDPMVALRTE